jgi:glycerol-3-phosphate dehydrogenase
MARIVREPAAAASKSYDLIIIGGGIYGAMLSLESSRLGLRSLLLERDDFGGATTFNSLRIIHGGIRYLQSIDLRRFRESVAERSWFIRNFPNLVKPLPCVLPIYGNGMRRRSIFRLVLWVNDLLSRRKNHGIYRDGQFLGGMIVDRQKTQEIFPLVDPQGLEGGAIWYDAFMPESQRVVIEILKWACAQGATVLNYMEASQLLKTKAGIVGVVAIDREEGDSFEYGASVVINAAGPWCRELAKRFDRDEPKLFRGSLAWNALFNRKPVSDHAVAVAPKTPGGRTYFLVPWKGMLLAGTGHAPWIDPLRTANPSSAQIVEFINDLNCAVPGLKLNLDDILHVFAGLLPVTRDGSVDLLCREVILNHAEQGGPQGLYSISGIKFTTARLVAEKTLRRIFPGKTPVTVSAHKESSQFPRRLRRWETSNSDGCLCPSDVWWKIIIERIIEEESILHLDDLIFRRTTLWQNSEKALELAPVISDLFSWDDIRRKQERDRLTEAFSNMGGSGRAHHSKHL